VTTGTVRWINEGKGFGLITPDGGGNDIFARFWAISADHTSKSVRRMQKVSSDVTADIGGEQAVNVKAIA